VGDAFGGSKEANDLTGAEELVRRAHRTEIEAKWAITQIAPRPRRRDWPGATAVACDVPSSVANVLFVTEPPSDPNGLLDEASGFFGPSTPWKMMAPRELAPTLERAAQRAVLTPSETVPGLLLDPVATPPAPPPGFAVRAVTDLMDFRLFLKAGAAGFGIPHWILRAAFRELPSAPANGDPPLQLFVGLAGGKPVATSALFVGREISEVSFVSTVPGARKHGYGAAITWAAVGAGRGRGGRSAYLRATEMGRSVYERMGFRWLVDYQEWHSALSGVHKLRAVLRALRIALV
jgi:GNAT superfamily N-acetyltransferase